MFENRFFFRSTENTFTSVLNRMFSFTDLCECACTITIDMKMIKKRIENVSTSLLFSVIFLLNSVLLALDYMRDCQIHCDITDLKNALNN